MHVLLTGASGTVGRFILDRLIRDGHSVTCLGRQPVDGFSAGFCRYDLADPHPELPQADALVHCALLHEPGRFRGGEGDDPEAFTRVNVGGTEALFDAAKRAGCRHAVFLSSRAVYGDHRRGDLLSESDQPRPDSLYGEIKLAGEQALEARSDAHFGGSVLRATGIYGLPPGLSSHKWSSMFEAFACGEEIAPRRATEVHGADLAVAVSLLLGRNGQSPFDVFNVSDLLLDQRELLELYAELSKVSGKLPDEAETVPGVMATDKLRALGWRPGGKQTLQRFLRDVVK